MDDWKEMTWLRTIDRPCFAQMRDIDGEISWALKNGYTKHTSVGCMPFDLPSLLKGKRKKPIHGIEPPCSFDHLVVYRNPKTNKRVAVFHEYPRAAQEKKEIIQAWCNENGLNLKQMSYSWYLLLIFTDGIIAYAQSTCIMNAASVPAAYSGRLFLYAIHTSVKSRAAQHTAAGAGEPLQTIHSEE